MGPLERVGDAAQHCLPGTGRVRQDQDARAPRQADPHDPRARPASRPSPRALTRTTRARGQRHGRRPAREDQAAEKWTLIEVPAIVIEETFELAQARLSQNAHFAKRNTKKPTLLQGILVPRMPLRLLPLHHPHHQQADLLLPLMRREAPCCIPGAAGRDSKGSPWVQWLTRIRKVRGTRACQETGDHAQVSGVRCRGTRVIWRKLDCLKPNLQKTQSTARRQDTCCRRHALRRHRRGAAATFGVWSAVQ
jgi:hypothetical protein